MPDEHQLQYERLLAASANKRFERSLKQKQRYYDLKQNGRCTRCGNPAEVGKVLCSQHADDARQASRETYRYRRLNNLCSICGSPAAQGQAYCVNHEDMRSQTSKKVIRSRRAQGVCIGCGKVKVTRFARCLPCRTAQAARQRALASDS